MKKLYTLLCVTIILMLSIHSAHAQESTVRTAACTSDKPIVFAGFNWDSAAFHNGVARYILEHGYGCKTDEVQGATIPLLHGMKRGNIHVSMEIWTQTVSNIWSKGVSKGIFTEIGVNLDDAVQAVFVPKYLVEGKDAPAPDLKKITDLKKYAHLFKDAEEPTKGRFYNCVLGWVCEKINTQKLIAYGLNDVFVNFKSGAGSAVPAVVESALLRKKPIVFYYWTPSWLIGKHQDELVILEEPQYDKAVFEAMKIAEKPTQATAYPATIIKIGVHSKLLKREPHAIEFLRNYHFNSDLVSQMLSHMKKQDKTPKETAIYFLQNHEDVWTPWLPQDAVTRVQSSLK